MKPKELAQVAYESFVRTKHGPGRAVWGSEGIDEQDGWRAATITVLAEARERGLQGPWPIAAQAVAFYAATYTAMGLGYQDAAVAILVAAPGAMAFCALIKPMLVFWRAAKAGDK